MAETNALQEILVTLGDKPLNVNVNIPGIKGDNGQDGHNGADGLSAYDIAQLNGFTGSQQEWLESLKAGAVADEARTMLLNGNVWCKSAAISDVLAAVISNLGKAFPRTEFKQLKVNVLSLWRASLITLLKLQAWKLRSRLTTMELDPSLSSHWALMIFL